MTCLQAVTMGIHTTAVSDNSRSCFAVSCVLCWNPAHIIHKRGCSFFSSFQAGISSVESGLYLEFQWTEGKNVCSDGFVLSGAWCPVTCEGHNYYSKTITKEGMERERHTHTEAEIHHSVRASMCALYYSGYVCVYYITVSVCVCVCVYYMGLCDCAGCQWTKCPAETAGKKPGQWWSQTCGIYHQCK